MRSYTRRSVAYIGGRIISGRSSSSIYDYSVGRYTNMSGRVADGRVAVYDYDQKNHISGSYSSLYHYGNNAFISLNISGNNFSGYDYDSGSHFSGHVTGNSISLYDYGAGSYFNYTI